MKKILLLLLFIPLLLVSCSSDEGIIPSLDDSVQLRAIDHDNPPDHICYYDIYNDGKCTTCGRTKPENTGGGSEDPVVKPPKPDHMCDYVIGNNPYCTICRKPNPDWTSFPHTCLFNGSYCIICGKSKGGGGGDHPSQPQLP